MAQLKQVAHFFDRTSAEVLKSALVAHGIDAVVLGDDMGGMRPDIAMGTGVRVLVREDQLEEAKALVHSFELGSNNENSDEAGGTHEDEIRKSSDPVRHAYNAAIYGTFILPGIAHVYSLYLLVRFLSKKPKLNPQDQRRIVIALLFNIGVLGVMIALILSGNRASGWFDFI